MLVVFSQCYLVGFLATLYFSRVTAQHIRRRIQASPGQDALSGAPLRDVETVEKVVDNFFREMLAHCSSLKVISKY